jgi:hypothetical protein
MRTIAELRARLRYLIDRVFAREFTGQFILFLVLVIVVTFIGMTAYFFGLHAPENESVPGIPRQIDRGFLDTLWWSLNQVLRLRGFERMYGATGPILAYALFLSVIGLAVFGILVSLINNTMRRRIEALRQGETPVVERGHVLILGWNNKIHTVLMQLARLQPGARAVILAPQDIPTMETQLRVAGVYAERISIILRSGRPSNLRELQRVALDYASSVIVLSTDDDDRDSIKTLVLLAAKTDWPGPPPTLTCEIALEQNHELAKIAARGCVHLISSSRVISKVIVQTMRNPGLSGVYAELFACDGNGIFVQQVPGCEGATLGEVAYRFANAIPIGVAWREETADGVRHAAGLNPGADYDIAPDEQLVLMARSLPVRLRDAVPGWRSDLYREGGQRTRVPRRVLLIGWNDILYDILQELDAHALSGTQVTILSGTGADEAREKVDAKLGHPPRNLSLEFREGDAADESAFDGVELDAFQSLVVLADDSYAKDDADTHTLRVLLRLSNLNEGVGVRAPTTVELLNSANTDLLTGLDVDEIVVSPDIVSAQLAQISRQRILGPIYSELLSAGGVEISVRPVGHYVELGTDCSFDDLTYAAQQKIEIALGLRLAANGGRVLLNPPRDGRWRLTEDDKAIVLAQQVYS